MLSSNIVQNTPTLVSTFIHRCLKSFDHSVTNRCVPLAFKNIPYHETADCHMFPVGIWQLNIPGFLGRMILEHCTKNLLTTLPRGFQLVTMAARGRHGQSSSSPSASNSPSFVGSNMRNVADNTSSRSGYVAARGGLVAYDGPASDDNNDTIENRGRSTSKNSGRGSSRSPSERALPLVPTTGWSVPRNLDLSGEAYSKAFVS